MSKLKPHTYTIVTIMLALGLVGSFGVAATLHYQLKDVRTELAGKAASTEHKTQDELIQDYYNTEVATMVSPHGVRLKMDSGEIDFVLVDVRSNADYQLGHIRGAINIPPDLPDEAKLARFQAALEAGKKERKSYLLLYCYASTCTLGRKTGKFLAANGIYAKEMTIGYNDWEMQHDVWNSPGEVYDIQNYITRGNEPGELKPSDDFLNRPCSTNSEFTC